MLSSAKQISAEDNLFANTNQVSVEDNLLAIATY
jgi:hypothetical protein